MARLNVDVCDSDEEYPDLETILRSSGEKILQTPRKGFMTLHGNAVTASYSAANKRINEDCPRENGCRTPKESKDVFCAEKQSSRQRPLKSIKVNSLLLPITNAQVPRVDFLKPLVPKSSLNDIKSLPSSPRKIVNESRGRKGFASRNSSTPESKEESSSDDLSDFIVHDSASESEVASTRSPRRLIRKPGKMPTPLAKKLHQLVIDDFASDREDSGLQKSRESAHKPSKKLISLADQPHLPAPIHSSSRNDRGYQVIDLTSPVKVLPKTTCLDSGAKVQSGYFKTENLDDQDHDEAPAILE